MPIIRSLTHTAPIVFDVNICRGTFENGPTKRPGFTASFDYPVSGIHLSPEVPLTLLETKNQLLRLQSESISFFVLFLMLRGGYLATVFSSTGPGTWLYLISNRESEQNRFRHYYGSLLSPTTSAVN